LQPIDCIKKNISRGSLMQKYYIFPEVSIAPKLQKQMEIVLNNTQGLYLKITYNIACIV